MHAPLQIAAGGKVQSYVEKALLGLQVLKDRRFTASRGRYPQQSTSNCDRRQAGIMCVRPGAAFCVLGHCMLLHQVSRTNLCFV